LGGFVLQALPCSIALRQLVSGRLLPLLKLLNLSGACRCCLVCLHKVRLSGFQFSVESVVLANEEGMLKHLQAPHINSAGHSVGNSKGHRAKLCRV
jgi:hypothetical protein